VPNGTEYSLNRHNITPCLSGVLLSRERMALATTPNGGGGYDYQFVDTPLDMFVCKICQYPSREPHLSGCCGHTFCKSCLEAAKRAINISQACPVCREEEFTTVPNKQVDRAIRSLHVFCTNKDKGCEWQGEVNDIINHLGNNDGCQFEEVTCSNDCGNCLQRQYLTSHVEDECVRRKVDCQYCHIAGEHQFIEGEHKEQCPKFPIACPNKCEADNIPREDFDEHRKMCPLEKVTCPNDCGMSLQRQCLTNHVKMECPRLKVDCQYCHITGENWFIYGEHKEQCPKFPIACPNKCEVGSVPRDDVEEHMKMCPLELIQCEYHVVGCEERMARKDQKKHNKEKMEDHLSFISHQLKNAQHHSTSGLKELTTKITRTENDLDTTKQLLSSVVKTIDQLIQRLQQTERDTTSQLEKCKDEIENEKKQSKEQLAAIKDDLILKLQQTENEITIAKQELVDDYWKSTQEEARKTKEQIAVTKQDLVVTRDELRTTKRNLQTAREEMKQEMAEMAKSLADTKADLYSTQEEARKTKDDLTQQLAVTKQEAKKTKDELTQKLTNTQRDLNTTKQQLATTCQNLTKAEKEHITLAANTDEALAKLETTFQTKITEIETAAQKRIIELVHENEMLRSFIGINKDTIQHYTNINTTASKLSSGDQVVPVIVKMSEYIKKKSGKIKWYSEAFFTHHQGYKMYLEINANGLGDKKDYMSVYLYLIKGPYDDQLRWPMKGHCEVKLLNQIINSEHHSGDGKYVDIGHKRVTRGERSRYYMWYSHTFIFNDYLHKITPTCQYLKNDSIFLQVDYKLD